MPTYPALPISKESSAERMVERDVRRATNGAGRPRVLGSGKWRFNIRHKALTAAERDTLDDFHDANSGGSFDLVWPLDGQTYVVFFAKGGDPKQSPLGRDLADVSVILEEA